MYIVSTIQTQLQKPLQPKDAKQNYSRHQHKGQQIDS